MWGDFPWHIISATLQDMQNAAHIVTQIITLIRQSGYLTPDHAVSVAGNILDAQPLPQSFAFLAPALIRHAAIFDPFDIEKLRLAEDVNNQIPHLPFTNWLTTARRLTAQEPVPENIQHPNPETASPADFVTYMRMQPANISRLPVLLHLWQSAAHDELLQAIEIMTASPSGLLAGPVMAWGAYGAGEAVLAGMILDESVTNFLAHNLRARMALDKGMVTQARQHLHDSLEAEPLQPAVIEQLADLEYLSGKAPSSDTHICLYTWNKPDLLAQTMESLAATDRGDARISILNNGTTQCTPEELEQRVATAAPNLAINWLHLPVNIGAPAARNWLLAQPAIRASRYVAYLDDDVLLPKHWLTRYIATLDRFTEAAAVGPKCVNPQVRTIQYAFRAFQEIGERKIRFTANAPTLMDMGQFDFPRPSLTVMGCCHLFHMERMTQLGVPDFDVRFSPSQVDDIEHDLQVWKAGGQVIFDGGVPVIHLQDTGGKSKTPAATAQAYANHYKMEHKFELKELQRMDAAMHQADTKHFRDSLDAILPQLGETALQFWKTISPMVR